MISEKHELRLYLSPRRSEPDQYGNMVNRDSAKKNREAKRFSGVLMSIFIGVVVNPECQGLIFGSVSKSISWEIGRFAESRPRSWDIRAE